MSDWSELYEALKPTRPEGSKTVAELVEETGKPESTVRRALRRQGYESRRVTIDGHERLVYLPKVKR